MIHFIQIGVALDRPPKTDQIRRYAIYSGTHQDAELVALQMASCSSTMPVSVEKPKEYAYTLCSVMGCKMTETEPHGVLGCRCWPAGEYDAPIDVSELDRWLIDQHCPYHGIGSPGFDAMEDEERSSGVHRDSVAQDARTGGGYLDPLQSADSERNAIAKMAGQVPDDRPLHRWETDGGSVRRTTLTVCGCQGCYSDPATCQCPCKAAPAPGTVPDTFLRDARIRNGIPQGVDFSQVIGNVPDNVNDTVRDRLADLPTTSFTLNLSTAPATDPCAPGGACPCPAGDADCAASPPVEPAPTVTPDTASARDGDGETSTVPVRAGRFRRLLARLRRTPAGKRSRSSP